MLVKAVMTRKVITASSTTKFNDLLRLLISKKISGLPIVNHKGKVIGVISEKDLFYKLFPSQKKFYKDIKFYMNFDNLEEEAKRVKNMTARNVMSRNVITVSPEDHILKACSLFLIHKIRRLPVVENGSLVGIITTNNIYKNFLLRLLSPP